MSVPTTKLEWALKHAADGFFVFQLWENDKVPIEKGFPEKATRDPAVIKKLWTRLPNANIAIYTGRFGDGDESLLVVDIDVKDGKDGRVTLAEQEFLGNTLCPTWSIRTTTGGEHRVYRTKKRNPGKVSLIKKKSGLDSRGDRNYIVAEGSTLNGITYRSLNDLPIAYVDLWFEELHIESGPSPSKDQPPVDFSVIDRDAANRWGQWYLMHDAEPSIAYDGGNRKAFAAAAKLKDRGVTAEDALLLMQEHFNPRCDEKWSFEELRTIVRNAYKYGKNLAGCDNPQVVFPPVDPPAPEEVKELHPYDKLNVDHAFVIAGGGSHILWETTNADGKEAVEHLDLATFKNKLANQKMMVGNKTTSVASQWLEWKGRRSYDGIIFSPGQPPEVSTDINERPKRYFNLWRGFAYEPAPYGSSHPSLDLFLEHLNLNVCGGSEALYRWLLGFFAHLVQCPEQKPEVAIVLRGGKGVGKTMVAETIGDLLGRHFLLTSDRRYLTGNFNGHLENCLMLVLDEAFWSGDKQAEGTLKNLITGREHVIEHKGKEPYVVANKTRIIICSNENWVVPVSHDERRFAFFDVGDGRKQDRVYFGQIRDGLRNGGYPVLLRYLLGYPLAGIDINTAPVTAGLLDQKLQSDDPLRQFWHACLDAGCIVGSEFEGWPTKISCDRFRDAFKRDLIARNIKTRLPADESIGRMLSALGLTRRRQRNGKERLYAYDIPVLSTCRDLWDKSTGQPATWDSDENE